MVPDEIAELKGLYTSLDGVRGYISNITADRFGFLWVDLSTPEGLIVAPFESVG